MALQPVCKVGDYVTICAGVPHFKVVQAFLANAFFPNESVCYRFIFITIKTVTIIVAAPLINIFVCFFLPKWHVLNLLALFS